MRPSVPEGVSDDPFGRWQVGFGGANVGVEIVPSHAAEAQSQVLQQPLGDEADLDVPLIGGELAAYVLAILGRFAVQMLVAIAPTQGSHDAHPEVISISANRVNGLPKAGFDFETPGVEAQDVQ